MATAGNFTFFKKFECKKKCLEFFKSNEILKTLQQNGWKSYVKCTKCENADEPHRMNSVTRICSSSSCNKNNMNCSVKYK